MSYDGGMRTSRFSPAARSLAWCWGVLLVVGVAGAATLQTLGGPASPPEAAAPEAAADVASAPTEAEPPSQAAPARHSVRPASHAPGRAARMRAWDRFVEHAKAALAADRLAVGREQDSAPAVPQTAAPEAWRAPPADPGLAAARRSGPPRDNADRPFIGAYVLGPDGVRTFVRTP